MGVPAGAEDGHGKLHAIDPLLDVHGLVVGQRIEHRLAQLLLAFHLVNAQGAAAMGRLPRADRIPADDAVGHHIERRGRAHALESIARQVDALGPGRAALLAGQVAVLRQRRVQGVLVPSAMADARRRAHERDAEELQQTLDGAVLAVLAVQGRCTPHRAARCAAWEPDRRWCRGAPPCGRPLPAPRTPPCRRPATPRARRTCLP